MPRLDMLEDAMVYNAPQRASTRTCELFAHPKE
jgi:hypothetical protein